MRGLRAGRLHEMFGPMPSYPNLQRFAVAPKDLHAVVPKTASLEDQVWVLSGAMKPVLLRPEGKDCYSFLGEVLLLETTGSFSDIMFGSLSIDYYN